MSSKLTELIETLDPARTVLLFGSGSSIPSGAPSVADLIAYFSRYFSIPASDYSLSEITSLAERKASRLAVIKALRERIQILKPAGSLRNLPLYPWKSIYTTNYDTLIEDVYAIREKSLRIYHSDFCFTTGDANPECELFKLHGTIDLDISYGHNSRIILTEGDYDQTERYRRYLYDRLKGDLAGSDLIVIGHSLSDPDIRNLVTRAAEINADVLSPARISLLMYEHDENRAMLWESRGIRVAFGGIDNFFELLAPRLSGQSTTLTSTGNILDGFPTLRPVTTDVSEAISAPSDISTMFNGRPATYADIEAGYTFQRNVAQQIAAYFEAEPSLCVTLLGASGVGKTSAARQALHRLQKAGAIAWEHQDDHALSVDSWCTVAESLRAKLELGVLLVDDAHHHLQEVNDLVDRLVHSDNAHLKIIVISARNHWTPRIKTPNLYKYGTTFTLSQLSSEEVESLLTLLERSDEVRALVENQFSGFSKAERRRRLTVRCEADMFVCMKNIFANDSFDNIVLQEYADLSPPLRDIYRYVAAMETAGVRVHRQLIIRLLKIRADGIHSILESLADIINEYTIDKRRGVFGWRCRHPVISSIITKYKFVDIDRTIELFDEVIDNISPTYDIEIRSLRELCNIETGISRIPNKNEQNRLLRKMMSNAPGERVPRHRLIRNLIDQGHFEKAETEIRLFNKDFGSDGPVHRYKIKLMIERATRTRGILEEDRIAILEQAHALAVSGAERYSSNKNILSVYGDLGIEYYKRTGDFTYYEEAIGLLERAEEYLGDPQISSIIRRLSRRIAGGFNAIDEDASEAATVGD